MKTEIKLYKGDVTELEVEAIVNAANNYRRHTTSSRRS